MAGYVIQVGNDRPGEAIVAQVNKKTGEPTGPQMKRYIPVGSHLIINQARVWGRRYYTDKAGKKVTEDVDFNTVGYKGDIEFMEWGKDGGYAIEIRYLPQSRSLDFEYQQNVQKIVVRENQEGKYVKGAHIVLGAGENKFDDKKDELFVTCLRVHPQNRNSKSKNPDPAIKGYVYHEVTDEDVDQSSIKRIDTSIEAGTLVKNISSKPSEIRNLFKIIGKREEFGSTTELSGDGQIYKVLLEYAHSEPVDFFYLIGEYKRGIEEAFRKAESYKALDLTKDGHIALEVSGKKHLIISDVKAKGEGMVQWMLDHYYEDEVFMATQRFKELVSKLK
jgi:hypothetical protein